MSGKADIHKVLNGRVV